MEALFIYLLKSAGVLTIFFLAYKLLFQKETFFALNRHYLLGGIIASLLLPLVVFTTYIYVEPVAIQESAFYDIPITITEYSTTEPATPFDWSGLLFNIYLLGIIFVGTQFIIQLLSLYKIVKSGVYKRHNSFNLIEVTDQVSPFSFFNYIIYNPENFSHKDLEIILNHEKAHGKQLHTIDILLSQLFLIFQWFNPVVWFYKKTIQQNLEFMADKEAISTIESKQNYQRTLLKVSVASYCTSITNNFYNSLIKKRIVMLNQSSSKTQNLWKYSLILPALALFLVSFNTETLEIVKESESVLNEIPDSQNPQPSDNLIIAMADEELSPSASKKEEHVMAERVNTLNDVIVKITKDTTKEELDNIKEDLRKKGMEFSYSNLDYNSANEITRIKIKYKDKTSGNSGSYHVNTDDNEPIKPIYVYSRIDGGIGLGSSPNEREHKERMKVHKERLAEHKERLAEHKELMYEHKQKMKEHNEKIKEEHEGRMEEHKERMEEHKAKMEEEHETRIHEIKERHEHLKEDREAHLKEHKEHMEERKARMEERQHKHIKELKERTEERKARLEEKRKERKVKVRRKKDGNVFVHSDDKDDSNSFVYRTSNSEHPTKIRLNNGEKPIFIIDGEIVEEHNVSGLRPDDIASINVLKGDSAIAIYGENGGNGAVQIITKENNSSKKIKSYYAYATNSDADSVSENEWVSESTLIGIDKSTTNASLNSFKKQLQEQGIDFKYSNIKRNKKGQITRIKLRLNDNEGSKVSSTYDTSPNAISKIVFGKKGKKLIINSGN